MKANFLSQLCRCAHIFVFSLLKIQFHCFSPLRSYKALSISVKRDADMRTARAKVSWKIAKMSNCQDLASRKS